VLAGFVLFRVFDIWKPLGAREAQRLPGGWGIVIDDVLAGLYALALLHLALHFWGLPAA
jgi:phosphatidylglycerophosphatase A